MDRQLHVRWTQRAATALLPDLPVHVAARELTVKGSEFRLTTRPAVKRRPAMRYPRQPLGSAP
jgi:hypothetical protein